MIIFAIFAYAAVIVLIGALVFFEGFRNQVIGFLCDAAHVLRNAWSSAFRRGSENLDGLKTETEYRIMSFKGFATRYRWWLVGTCCFVITPIFFIVIFSDRINDGGVPDISYVSDESIRLLLDGEHLVLPKPPPPESFTTVEVVAERPALATADRRWDKLDPDFELRLLHVFNRMESLGYKLVLLEGYRSPERQDQLAAMGNHVTNARAFQSYHQFGLAADCAFLRDGKIVISERDPWAMRGYQLYGQEAQAVGLVWGGSWKMMDLGHVELHARKLPKPN